MHTYDFTYPRRTILRSIVKGIGKIIIPILFKLEFEGFENFPKKGPVLIVGNHYALMEAVLIIVYSPYNMEFMGSVDVPHEKLTDFFFNLYQVIPVYRGKTEQGAMRKAVEILNKNGAIGIFPEGGHYDPSHMEAHSGVAWLSHKTQTPVIPIGVSGSIGSVGKAFAFKRQTLKMAVGEPVPPMQVVDRSKRKEEYKNQALMIMERVWNLLTDEEHDILNEVQNESFKIKFHALNSENIAQEIPQEFEVKHADALVEFFYKTLVFKDFRSNYQLPMLPLESIHQDPSNQELIYSLKTVIAFLEDEENGNPYYLTFRYGVERGTQMKLGMKELLNLIEWCESNHLHIDIEMQREYDSLSKQQHIVQVEQEVHVFEI